MTRPVSLRLLTPYHDEILILVRSEVSQSMIESASSNV